MAEEQAQRAGTQARNPGTTRGELMAIVSRIKELLARIDQDIPLIQLAITASGESLSTNLPPGISPSRLMQASTFLSFGDMQFASDPTQTVQVGPTFTLSMYMLFVGHGSASPSKPASSKVVNVPTTPERPGRENTKKEEKYGFEEGDRKPIWQEVIHKARVRLCRMPLHWTFDRQQGYSPDGSSTREGVRSEASSAAGRPDEYSYHIEIVEDLDDGRLHEEDGARYIPFDGIAKAGIRESVPIYQISKIFYTDTGRILNIGNATDGDNNPVLLLKRDTNAPAPSRLRDEWMGGSSTRQTEEAHESREPDAQTDVDRQLREESQGTRKEKDWGFPTHVDPEWLAFEVYAESGDETSDDEDDATDDAGQVGTGTMSVIKRPEGSPKTGAAHSKLITQLRSISFQTSPSSARIDPSSSSIEKEQARRDNSLVASSPFGVVTSSLSLMEMLIRLTSLQEFQQISHLSIPDHITTFFLEETSSTGLRGEARWEERRQAKRKVGFDPYIDTPSK